MRYATVPADSSTANAEAATPSDEPGREVPPDQILRGQDVVSHDREQLLAHPAREWDRPHMPLAHRRKGAGPEPLWDQIRGRFRSPRQAIPEGLNAGPLGLAAETLPGMR